MWLPIFGKKEGSCCYYTYFHLIYDIIFGGLFIFVQYWIARDWVYWDNSPSRFMSFITLDYIFVFLAFRFSQLWPREFLVESRGGMWLSSFFAAIFGIWGLVKYFKYGLPAKLKVLTIILIILSFILLIYFVFMSIYWPYTYFKERNGELERLNKDVRSDEYRRYGREKSQFNKTAKTNDESMDL